METPISAQNNCVSGETITAVEDSKKSFLDKIPTKTKKSALIIAIIVIIVVAASIIAHNHLSPRAIAKRYAVAIALSDNKTKDTLSAYDYKKAQLEGDEEAEEYFVEQSDFYDENIQSWNKLYSVVKKQQHEDYEDIFGKNYKLKSEVKKERDYSTNKLETIIQEEINSDFEYESYEALGLFKDSISAGKKIVVRTTISGDTSYGWKDYSIYLVKTNGLWKVIDWGVESDD